MRQAAHYSSLAREPNCVLLRLGKVGTVQSVAEQPAALGEYMHEVLVDGEAQSRRVMGCELEAVPDAQ